MSQKKPDQSQRFIDAAKKLATDENEKAFEKRLKTLAGGASSTGKPTKPRRVRKK